MEVLQAVVPGPDPDRQPSIHPALSLCLPDHCKKAYRRSGASPRFAPGAALLPCCARTSLTLNCEGIMKYLLLPGKSWAETRFQGKIYATIGFINRPDHLLRIDITTILLNVDKQLDTVDTSRQADPFPVAEAGHRRRQAT